MLADQTAIDQAVADGAVGDGAAADQASDLGPAERSSDAPIIDGGAADDSGGSVDGGSAIDGGSGVDAHAVDSGQVSTGDSWYLNTSGGGRASSASYSVRLFFGAPQPYGAAAGSAQNVQLGP